MPQDLSFGAYAVQGVFADIYPYLQADETFDMADYRENVFHAYEVSEKLYALPIAFTVDGMYGKASDLGGQTKWNMDELIAFADRFPGSLIFENPAKTAVLDICLKANGGNMVDWASKDAGFDRDLLVKILAFANRFVDAESIPGESDFANRLSDGDIRLMPWFANVNTQMQSEIFGGSAVSYIGFPSEKGNGYLIYANAVVAISSKCEYTETAYQFIRYLLSDDVQSMSGLAGYPVKRRFIEATLEHAKRDGGIQGFGNSGGDFYFSVDIHPVTDEEIEQFLNVLDAVNEIRVYDQTIDRIIKEEAAAYFSGQKPVEAVADIIENRVGIYVREIK